MRLDSRGIRPVSPDGHVSGNSNARKRERIEAEDADRSDDSRDYDTDNETPDDEEPPLFSTSKPTPSHKRSYTRAEESHLLRRLDRHLVLFLSLLYLLSFLDRSNIGNARIAGLESSLRLLPGQYDSLLTAFYTTYILFEWMTLLYRVFPAHVYISACVFSWGLVASLQAVSTSFPMLLVCRALLGVTEAAFGPGVPFYLSFFYQRHELAFRVGLFVSAAPLASSCASALAWVIVRVARYGPIEPWRALFLVEGLPSLIVAVLAWWVIPDGPGTASFLSPRLRRVAVERVKADQVVGEEGKREKGQKLSWTEMRTTLTDPKTYLTAGMFFSANVAFSSLPVFLPTILAQAQGTPSLTAQILSAPPYLASFAFVLVVSHFSDRLPNTRAIFIIISSLLSSASYLLLALVGIFHSSLTPNWVFTLRYMSVFGASMGFFAAVTLIITWTLNNQGSASGRGTGVVVLNILGQCGPLLGTRLYPRAEGPWYVRGMFVCCGAMGVVAGLAAGLRTWLGRLNRREEVEKGGGMAQAGEEGLELSALRGGEGSRGTGGRSLSRARRKRFRYIL